MSLQEETLWSRTDIKSLVFVGAGTCIAYHIAKVIYKPLLSPPAAHTRSEARGRNIHSGISLRGAEVRLLHPRDMEDACEMWYLGPANKS
ncbi:hypothetical protein CGRA01v4_06941 [Colletotrichum graminicola]|nr:hypothetical protein CGRA01v4_06941 [Colletotrichum graminicola]